MNDKPSALQEKDGVSKPETTSKVSAEKIKKSRARQNSVNEFVTGVLNGNITFLSKAITLVESTNIKHQQKANEILNRCLPHSNKSIRIGITGVPGVGKSTFIETFGKYLTAQGKKVAVLAVDPSSSVNKGSILGDKTIKGGNDYPLAKLMEETDNCSYHQTEGWEQTKQILEKLSD